MPENLGPGSWHKAASGDAAGLRAARQRKPRARQLGIRPGSKPGKRLGTKRKRINHAAFPHRPLFQGGLANVTPHASTTYNFANDERAPLLFISGGNDHILPPAVQHENYQKNA
jgi:hypothetical protein